MKALDTFTKAYVEAALWSTCDDNDIPLDRKYTIADISESCLNRMIRDCEKFQEENADLLALAGDPASNGHDFWLTRNNHGAGFWDRQWAKGYNYVGDELTDAAHKFGWYDLYVVMGEYSANPVFGVGDKIYGYPE